MRLFQNLFTTFFALVLLSACGDEERSFNSQTIDNNAVLTSSTLSSLFSVAAACGNSETRCTPENVQGDLCYAIYGMGTLGGDYFGGKWLWPDSVTDLDEDLETGTCSATTFNLSSSTTFDNGVQIPASAGDMPSNNQILRVELNFNYVDVTVTINNGTLNDTYVIRTVYASNFDASDVDSTMQQGDKLYKASGDSKFSWCNSSSCNNDRATVASGLIQDSTVTDYVHPGDGNTSYIPVTANFGENSANAVTVSYDELANTGLTWTLDFDVTNAIVWSAAPSTFSNVRDMLSAFRLKFGPNQSHNSGRDG